MDQKPILGIVLFLFGKEKRLIIMSFNGLVLGEVGLLSFLIFISFVPESTFSSLPKVRVGSISLTVLTASYIFLFFCFIGFIGGAINTKPRGKITQLPFTLAFFPFYFSILVLSFFFPNPLAVQFSFLAANTMFVAWVIWVLADWFSHRDDPIKSYPLIGSLPQFLASFPRRHIYESEMTEKHGLTLRVKVGDQAGIWVSDPADVEYMLKTNQANYEQGEGRKVLFDDLLGDGIFNVDGHRWLSQRKTASKEFSVGRFRDYMLEIFSEYALGVLARLEAAAESKQPVDLQDLFFRYTFDSFGKLAFGLDVGCLEKEETPAFANAFDRANLLTCGRFFDAFWPLKKLLGLGTEGELAEHIKTIDEYVYKIIRDRKKLSPSELEGYCDFLSRFMTMKDEQGNLPTDKYLRDLIVNFMLAGRDTTASGLSWTIFHVYQYPELLEKARKEIAQKTGADSMDVNIPGTDITLQKPSFAQLRDMSFLHAMFSESLRLNPPVPSDGKTAREDDRLPSGTKVNTGDMVAFMPFAMGRSPKLWDNPLEYRPERWLDAEGNFKRESPFKFSVFQAGPRQCLGVDFAYLEAKLILSLMLQRYNIKLCKPPKEHTEGEALTMSIAGGLPVLVERI